MKDEEVAERVARIKLEERRKKNRLEAQRVGKDQVLQEMKFCVQPRIMWYFWSRNLAHNCI